MGAGGEEVRRAARLKTGHAVALQGLPAADATTVAPCDPAQHNVALVCRYLAETSGQTKPPALLERYIDDAELKAEVAFLERVFPHHAVIAEDFVAQGDRVAVRARLQGTNSGELMGMAPTLRAVNVPFIAIYRIAGARIAQHWTSIDQAELLRQIGIAGRE